MSKTALLISSYHAASHAYWASGVVKACKQFQWKQLKLPARNFSWRVRGSGLSLLDERYRDYFDPQPELVLATSMLDLSTARAVVPALRAVPVAVYFHENQFAYPSTGADIHDIQLLGIKTAAAADCVIFNSRYNRDTFFAGASELLGKMPDCVPPHLLASLERRARVMPVPLAASEQPRSGMAKSNGKLKILWNHRWEYDKGPDRLLAALRELRKKSSAFELYLCGQQFRRQPACFDDIKREFAAELQQFGYLPSRQDYLGLLREMDVVVSTSMHEFQGLAVLEAVQSGCVPLVPDRLAYQELFAAQHRYRSHADTLELEAKELAGALDDLIVAKLAGEMPPAPSVDSFAWANWASAYFELLDKLEVRAH